VIDLDAGRLMQEEGVVKAAVRKLHLKARVTMMADKLAISRMGLMEHVPASGFNGRPILLQEVMQLLQNLAASR